MPNQATSPGFLGASFHDHPDICGKVFTPEGIKKGLQDVLGSPFPRLGLVAKVGGIATESIPAKVGDFPSLLWKLPMVEQPNEAVGVNLETCFAPVQLDVEFAITHLRRFPAPWVAHLGTAGAVNTGEKSGFEPGPDLGRTEGNHLLLCHSVENIAWKGINKQKIGGFPWWGGSWV